jgi:hypothetical protein
MAQKQVLSLNRRLDLSRSQLGLKLYGRVNEATFRKVVLVLLLLSGAPLVVYRCARLLHLWRRCHKRAVHLLPFYRLHDGVCAYQVFEHVRRVSALSHSGHSYTNLSTRTLSAWRPTEVALPMASWPPEGVPCSANKIANVGTGIQLRLCMCVTPAAQDLIGAFYLFPSLQ